MSQDDNHACLRVLVVEDLKPSQLYLQIMLKRHHCHVDIASTGAEAVEKARVTFYDIIFMDCQMPEMDGFEATRMIRRQTISKQPYIIALTAQVTEGTRERCVAAGMDSYVCKPLKSANVAKILKRHAG